MWFVTQHSSSTKGLPRTRYLALSIIALFAVALPALTSFGALVTTDRYIVTADSAVSEDQYVTSVSSIVEGTIDGNLTVFTGSLTVSGEITGSVTVFSSGTVTIEETGRIGGSLNGTATALSMDGTVGTDVLFTAGSVVVEDNGTVERDLLAFGGTARVDGAVGRDMRGRSFRTTIDGSVGGDVDIATQSLSIAATGAVGGDLVYRSPSDAEIADGATITGTVTKLPTQSNFVYSLVLSLANVIGFLGFVVAGLVVLWMFRGSGARAVGVIITKPIRTLLAGMGVVIVFPLMVALLAVTLVGIPLAVVVLALGVVAFVIGAVPAVTALGNRILFSRGGLFGAFLVGAILWRLGIWLIPYVGGFLFLLGLVWGLGGWILGILATRRADPVPAALIPASLIAADGAPEGWEPPRAPSQAQAEAPATVVTPPGAEAAVIADEVVSPTREQIAVGGEAPRSEPHVDPAPDAEGTEDEGAEAEDVAPAPDPSRERDLTSEPSTISFAPAAATTAAVIPPDPEDADAPDAEPGPGRFESDTTESEAEPGSDGHDRAPVEDPATVDEPTTVDEPNVSLEERLAALRRELDEAEADDDQPFAEFFKQQDEARDGEPPAPPTSD